MRKNTLQTFESPEIRVITIEANSNVLGHFGDLSLTFEVVEY